MMNVNSLAAADHSIHCHLLGGIFSSMIQAFLAILCIGTLMIKREQEHPRREWLVWFLDVAKQGLGSTVGHVANIYLSIIISKTVTSGDQCQWYCLTYVVDCTIGTFLNLWCIRVCEYLLQRHPKWQFLNFGDYGDTPSIKLWIPQLIVWIFIVVLGKIIILVVLKNFIEPLNIMIGFLFLVFRDKPHLELVTVMIVIPTILNTVIFWVTDTFLKRHSHNARLAVSEDEGDLLVEESDNTSEDGDLTSSSVVNRRAPQRSSSSSGSNNIKSNNSSSARHPKYDRISLSTASNENVSSVTKKRTTRKQKESPNVGSSASPHTQQPSMFSVNFIKGAYFDSSIGQLISRSLGVSPRKISYANLVDISSADTIESANLLRNQNNSPALLESQSAVPSSDPIGGVGDSGHMAEAAVLTTTTTSISATTASNGRTGAESNSRLRRHSSKDNSEVQQLLQRDSTTIIGDNTGEEEVRSSSLGSAFGGV